MKKNTESTLTIDFDNLCLVGELHMTYKSKFVPQETMNQSIKIYDYLKEIWPDTMEHAETFFVVFLNRANKCMGHYLVGRGGMTGTVADIRIIFQAALMAHCTSIVLAHNHPSGNLTPSESDLQLTARAIDAGKTLDIKVVDHLIMSKEGYYSFTDRGHI